LSDFLKIMKRIFIGSDHAGFDLKKGLMELEKDHNWMDCGTNSNDSVDYPDFADKVCRSLIKEIKNYPQHKSFGVLICGSGQGMAMRANKYPEIRAALCFDPEMAALARQHNDANILVMGGRVTDLWKAQEIFRVFMTTEFEGGRHQQRVAKLSKSSDTP
jgi:ribose 5-phosphate isomerase B